MDKMVISLIAMTALLQGCAWVKLSPEGEQARVLTSSQTENCTRLGVTTVSMPSRLGIIPLNQKKVNEELQKLARNAVADFKGADSVHALGEPQDGKQTFEIYDCLK